MEIRSIGIDLGKTTFHLVVHHRESWGSALERGAYSGKKQSESLGCR
jgi:hypothetical protein